MSASGQARSILWLQKHASLHPTPAWGSAGQGDTRCPGKAKRRIHHGHLRLNEEHEQFPRTITSTPFPLCCFSLLPLLHTLLGGVICLQKSPGKLQFGGALISSRVDVQTRQTRPTRQAVTLCQPPPLPPGCAWGIERPPGGRLAPPGSRPERPQALVSARALPLALSHGEASLWVLLPDTPREPFLGWRALRWEPGRAAFVRQRRTRVTPCAPAPGPA